MRSGLAVGCLMVMLVGCGSGGELSLTEYAESLEALTSTLIDELAVADARMPAGTSTIDDARDVLAMGLAIRTEFHDALVDLNPPELVADLHADLVDLDARTLTAQTELAARAEASTTLEELQQSVEFTAYGDTQISAISVCRDLQATLDATASRGAFAETPWIPDEIKEVVEVTFGC